MSEWERHWRFNLAIEMLIISGLRSARQGGHLTCFNLAIEMLIISGPRTESVTRYTRSLFQSRNRDAYHFRTSNPYASSSARAFVSISQSRCLSFQVHARLKLGGRHSRVSISQSRCLSFQVKAREEQRVHLVRRFNLAIEMLIISGRIPCRVNHPLFDVSISQSRCLSFQVLTRSPCIQTILSRFNLAIEMLIISGSVVASDVSFGYVVSISQSRCLSFQADPRKIPADSYSRFNLAIEMLIISGPCPRSP